MWSFFSRDPVKDFAYDIGEKVNGFDDKSIWQLYKGKKKGTSELVSIFLFELKPGSENWLETAKASVKCLKTLRHPNILTFVDSLETDKLIYLVTEYVESLEMHLANTTMNNDQKKLAISWGLYQITKGLCFLNNDCNLLHNYICMSSVFVDRAGEWRLGGLDYVCSANQKSPSKLLFTQEVYNPPEVKSQPCNKEIPKWAADSWGLGCLIWEAFNGPLTKQSDLKCLKKMPNNITSLYCELVSANPSSRLNPSSFLNKCCIKGGFMKNKFVDTMLFLEEIQIKDTNEMNHFLNVLVSLLDTFPPDICKYKILNQLLNAFEFGNAGSAVLVPLFKLAKSLDDNEYQQRIVPCIVKLFSCKDRATRARLLQQMDQFIHHIQPSVVNDQIFPQVAQGFMDTNPTIREQTIKCMLHMASKLNYYNLNEEVLKHFARLQSRDSQGGIRTNTTVCLGKIAIYLHPQTRQRVLVPAFIRAMRDPFPPARTAGILAIAATQGFYTLNDCAIKVLPALCQLVVDPDKSVRDQAFKAIKGFLNKLEKVSEDPSLLEQMDFNQF
ncbi:N-terminal kinase-like protein [Centruroides sculpturatus]|uniref:N-terminal kinase-like protein n=1 Tax=Centruroides sculpturatus TaxID=218467 RepID=UPI000C6D234E|nr:N-terminal kinase-like protein [Centruroides sculpturatus]